MNAQEAKLKADTYEQRRVASYIAEIDRAIERRSNDGEYILPIPHNELFTERVVKHYEDLGYKVVIPQINLIMPSNPGPLDRPQALFNTGSISWKGEDDAHVATEPVPAG